MNFPQFYPNYLITATCIKAILLHFKSTEKWRSVGMGHEADSQTKFGCRYSPLFFFSCLGCKNLLNIFNIWRVSKIFLKKKESNYTKTPFYVLKRILHCSKEYDYISHALIKHFTIIHKPHCQKQDNFFLSSVAQIVLDLTLYHKANFSVAGVLT